LLAAFNSSILSRGDQGLQYSDKRPLLHDTAAVTYRLQKKQSETE
jgi:hypothetical protein